MTASLKLAFFFMLFLLTLKYGFEDSYDMNITYCVKNMIKKYELKNNV